MIILPTSAVINSEFERNSWVVLRELEPFDDTALSEDLAQYEKGEYVLDFGFYGDEHNPEEGEYVIYILKQGNWDEHVANLRFKQKEMALHVLKVIATELPI